MIQRTLLPSHLHIPLLYAHSFHHSSTPKLSFLAMGLLSDADDTASRSGACVTGLLALFVIALAEVVGAGVDDDSALLQEKEALVIFFSM